MLAGPAVIVAAGAPEPAMNPFLHDTIARPLSTPADTAVGTATAPSPTAAPPVVPGSGVRASARIARRMLRLAGQLTVGLGVALAGGAVAHAVDLNTATQTELESVRGVGPKTAETIMRERQKGGAFKSFEDFSGRVRGIGTKRAQKLRDAGLTVGPAATTTASATPVPTASMPAAANPRNTPRPAGGKAN
jgi:competence protein ComEA